MGMPCGASSAMPGRSTPRLSPRRSCGRPAPPLVALARDRGDDPVPPGGAPDLPAAATLVTHPLIDSPGEPGRTTHMSPHAHAPDQSESIVNTIANTVAFSQHHGIM